MRTTRRFILNCLACAPGLPLMLRSGPGFAALEGGEPAAAMLRSLAAMLRSLVDDARRAGTLGESYRAGYPAEVHPGVLAGLICSSLGLGVSGAAALERAALRALLDRQVRAEFGAGDIVRVNGWVLARTEARLCALCE
jgi:hypothetical protein